jgi:mono/diheme cytochrome c family protein
MDKKIFGVTGIFSKPEAIIKAASETADAGYTKFDVNTPYPVHGMDKAMQLKPSRLGYITLVFGLSGAVFALVMMYFMMAKDYPMIIGGKPFFALPAFIPVTFELTVLFATLATVIGMITFFFKFPANAHPLHDSAYMKAVSEDKFGLCLEAADPLFTEEKAVAFLQALGAEKIESHYYAELLEIKPVSAKFVWFLVAVFVAVSGATYFSLNKLLYIMPFTWMSQQNRVNAQSVSDFYADGYGMRMPVKGTVSRGHIPYLYKDSTKMITQPVVNPTLPTNAVLALGQRKFLTFCSPCHGNYAEGDSRLHGQFPKPPSLHSQKIRDYQDGNIYHIIMVGQNVMPSYANQLTSEEVWAIVNYVRVLQKAKNATEEDIKETKKEAAPDVAR